MSDPLPRDELASAYLDGEVTPDERALVDADPALLARVEELRAVRRAVAVPVPARPAAAVDDAIRTALAAGGDGDIGDVDAPDGAAPAPLARRSGSRRRRSGIGLALLGAAAAVVALVAVAVNRTSGGDSPSAGRSLTVAAAPTTEAGGGAAAAVAAATTLGPPATTAAGAATTAAGADAAGAGAADGIGVPALGAVEDADGLRAALQSVPETVAASTSSAADVPCTVPDAHLVATVVWRGTLAFVFVDSAGVADVVGQSGCASLGTVPLS